MAKAFSYPYRWPILLAMFHSHFINCNHGWTRNETDAGGESKRNRRQRVASKSLPNIAYSLFVCLPSGKRHSRNRFASKYHNHASSYSLPTVSNCRFIYFHEKKLKRSGHGHPEQNARMSGKIPMTGGAQQPISAIAAGDSAVTPPSLLDNGRRCENADVLRIIKMAMNRTKQQLCHL